MSEPENKAFLGQIQNRSPKYLKT